MCSNTFRKTNVNWRPTGKYWRTKKEHCVFSFPRVRKFTRRLTRTSAISAVTQSRNCATNCLAAGFEILKLRYYNFAGYFAWWLNFCILKKRGFGMMAVRCFDRIIFPPVHWFESWICAPPIGQSLLAIARAK